MFRCFAFAVSMWFCGSALACETVGVTCQPAAAFVPSYAPAVQFAPVASYAPVQFAPVANYAPVQFAPAQFAPVVYSAPVQFAPVVYTAQFAILKEVRLRRERHPVAKVFQAIVPGKRQCK